MTSLVHNDLSTSPIQFLFVNKFSKLFLRFLRLLECKTKRTTRSQFSGDVSEQGDMQKGSFQRMV